MPDYLTIPSAVACLVLCSALVASILGLATDDWLEIKQISTSSKFYINNFHPNTSEFQNKM